MSLHDDVVLDSIGTGAKRLTFVEASFSGECLRALLDDLEVVSIGSGSNRRGLGLSFELGAASAGVLCGGGIVGEWANGPDFECRLFTHTLLSLDSKGPTGPVE